MISTIKQNKNTIFKSIIKTICVIVFWLLVWEIVSRAVSYNNELLLLILPRPITVIKKWTQIALTKPFIMATLLTLVRIFIGFILGTVVGFLLGIITHISKVSYTLLSPVLKMIRAIPVVAIIILMYLFFDSATLPVLIVCLMIIPIVWQTIDDGLKNTDIKLLEAAKVFNLSCKKTLLNIKIPSVMQSFKTTCVNALGLAWKSGVAAEVISLPDVSLGALLWQGKGTVSYDEVYAVTLTVVLLSILIEFLLKLLLKGGSTK